MSKATKPIDIPLRASKKGLVGIGQNLLSDEGGSVELVVGKPTRYSKSAKEEIETDKIDILSPSLESNSFMSGSDLQSLSLAEEVSVPQQIESEVISGILSPLSASNKENITSVPAVYVSASESAKETLYLSLHAISEPISIPSSSKSIRPMASESLTDDIFLSVGSSDKDSGIGTTLQSDLEVNKKSLEQGFIQEEQEITTLGDGYFIFQLDE
ncbi:MAG: hypothetical protein H6911_01630 [Rickettsiaceae bacterium]|nr:hypothetical protein [Rickettsiaceae bacterium]